MSSKPSRRNGTFSPRVVADLGIAVVQARGELQNAHNDLERAEQTTRDIEEAVEKAEVGYRSPRKKRSPRQSSLWSENSGSWRVSTRNSRVSTRAERSEEEASV